MTASPRVLTVDDDKDLLKLVEILLKRIGCETVGMSDGQSALKWLNETDSLDLIILDLMLPDIDGFDILRHVRADERFNTVPVLILSAKADPTTIRQGLDNGADGYVTKPYLAKNLTSRVQSLLGSRGQQAID